MKYNSDVSFKQLLDTTITRGHTRDISYEMNLVILDKVLLSINSFLLNQIMLLVMNS